MQTFASELAELLKKYIPNFEKGLPLQYSNELFIRITRNYPDNVLNEMHFSVQASVDCHPDCIDFLNYYGEFDDSKNNIFSNYRRIGTLRYPCPLFGGKRAEIVNEKSGKWVCRSEGIEANTFEEAQDEFSKKYELEFQSEKEYIFKHGYWHTVASYNDKIGKWKINFYDSYNSESGNICRDPLFWEEFVAQTNRPPDILADSLSEMNALWIEERTKQLAKFEEWKKENAKNN